MVPVRIEREMKTACISDDSVWSVLEWCTATYVRYGQKLALPANTDPRRTYQWRYASAIAKKFADWDFDEDDSRKFIDIAVRRAKEMGVMRKGLAILHQANMLTICYDILQEETKANARLLSDLDATKLWLQTAAGTRKLLPALLESRDGSLCNLVIWRRAHKMHDAYIALSKSCSQAISQLKSREPDQRRMLPTPTQLNAIRDRAQSDEPTLKQARKILDDDWRHLCQRQSRR
jgi:hypothetical protein